MIISPGIFFIFFFFSKFWFLGWLAGMLKGQKNEPKWQTILPISHLTLSQESYIIWLSFLVHMFTSKIVHFSLFFFVLFWGEGGRGLGAVKGSHFNSFLNKYLFFKFINKCWKEILRCAPPSWVCDFSFINCFKFLSKS